MTRTGSLAYYMAGIVCGSFFYTVVHFIADRNVRAASSNLPRDMLLAFFLGTIFGWFPQIVAAFLLRRVAVPLKWSQAWHWVVGGAGIFLFVFLVLGILGVQVQRFSSGPRFDAIQQIVFGQATLSARAGVAQGLISGALTSFVLYRVQRAFGEPIKADT